MAIKPVSNVQTSDKVYGVDTDAYNPDGLLVVETIEELSRIPSERRTPSLRVKVNSTNKYYKVSPNNPEKFAETTLEEVNSSIAANANTAVTATIAELKSEIEKIKSTIDSLGDQSNSVFLTAEEANRLYASKEELEAVNEKLLKVGDSKAEVVVKVTDSEEFLALTNKVTTIEGELARLNDAIAAKADIASIPNVSTLVNNLVAALSKSGINISASDILVGGSNEPSVNPGEQEVVDPKVDPEEDTSKENGSEGQTSVGGVDFVNSNVVYSGIVSSSNPNESDILSLKDKIEANSLSGLEFDLGDEDDEGYFAIAAPAAISSGVSFVNRGNSFTQVPLYERTLTVGGVEYKCFVFEYNYEKIPFRLS